MEPKKRGLCRCNPPVVFPRQMVFVGTREDVDKLRGEKNGLVLYGCAWPVVNADDWCGANSSKDGIVKRGPCSQCIFFDPLPAEEEVKP